MELQAILESPLLGLDEETLKNTPRRKSAEFERWEDAQIQSENASKVTANFERIIFPLDKTKNKPVLENMWKCVIQVCFLHISVILE